MNNQRRKEIARIADEIRATISRLDELKGEIENVLQEEQDYYDAMPESFQNGDKGQRAQEVIDALQTAYDALDVDFEGDVLDQLETAGE
jgi:uncharacterized coiled-coil DUF342 family protein